MTIALIAHDSKKELMVQFCTAYCRILSQHKLVATGTTGKMIAEATGLQVQRFLAGVQGGDQQIASRIACKTGTPQRSETYYVGSTRKHYTNTMMVAYGPAEDAEIALGIVIEYGGGGARAGNLVADIFDAYYAMKDGSLTLDETGAGETADTTADGQDAVPETVENNDALADDTAPAEQPAA